MVLWGLYNVSRKRVPYIEETEKIESRTREKRELPRGRRLEKEDSQERELEKKIEGRGQSVAAFEIDN